MIKKSTRLALTLIMALVCLVTVFPFYIMFVMGTYYSEDLFKGLALLPSNYLMQNLNTVLSSSFLSSYANSLYIAVACTLISSISSAMAGFAFSKYEFWGKSALFALVLAMLMIPSQLGMIAYIWEMKQLGLTDTHLPLILPALSSSFGVFWMRQYITDSVPNEVLDSARIDGGNDVRIFFQIVLAFIRPALMSTGLLFFLWSWNSYMLPMLVLTQPRLYTIPLCIATLRDFMRVDYGAQILGLSLGTLPMLCVFIVFSKSLISGLTASAVKG